MGKKLIIFGVSGILLKVKLGGIEDILVSLGKEKEVKKVEEEYQKRKYAGPWGLEELVKLYKGFTKTELEKIAFNYCKKNLREETKEILFELKKRGHVLGAVSSNPQFLMDALSKFLPLDFSEGTRLEFKKGVATGEIRRKIDRYIRAKILKRKIKAIGFKREDVIVIGDSVTYLPVAKEAGLFIGFDSKRETLREVIDALIKQKNFQKIFKL